MFNTKRNNWLIPKNNFIFIFTLIAFSLVYFFIIPNFVPFYFIQDTQTVKNAMLRPVDFDQSYRNTALFFKAIGFSYNSSQFAIIVFSWIVMVFWLITVLRFNKQHLFSLTEGCFIILIVLLYGIEYVALTKDLLLILLMLSIINLYDLRKNLYVFSLGALIYAVFFRQYWFIVAFWAFILSLQKKPRIRKQIVILFLFSIAIIIGYNFYQHGQITDQRFLVNVNRSTDQHANSMLNNLLPNDGIFSDIINWCYLLLTLIIPIQGLASPNMLVYYFWIWLILFFIVKNNKLIDVKIMMLLLGYLAVQAMFEPDLGSTLRHQLPWAAVLYL